MADADSMVNLTIRAPASYIARADALLGQIGVLAPADDPLGLWAAVRQSRSVVLRLALVRGLQALEQDVAVNAEPPANHEPTEAIPAPRKVTAEPDDTEPASAYIRAYGRKPSRQSKPATVSGIKMRNWRQGKGLSQTEAAAMVDRKQAAWGRWERGEVTPKGPMMKRLTELVPTIDRADWATSAGTDE
jgi:DNA-binding transcriptional regulator YiaG